MTKREGEGGEVERGPYPGVLDVIFQGFHVLEQSQDMERFT